MTLFQVSYEDVVSMPLEKLNLMLNWRIKYEEEKQKHIEEEVRKQKTEVEKKSPVQQSIRRR